jgi:hypothetical protein
MTGRTLFTATEGCNQLRIELHNRSHLPFTLTCSTRHNGSPAWLELPRRYASARGAKLAAASIIGSGIKWHAVSEQPETGEGK